jgi:uncharacterized protein DUF3563
MIDDVFTLSLCGAPKKPLQESPDTGDIMRFSAPIDGWSAYYALLTEALSKSSQPASRAAADRSAALPAPRTSLLERIDHWFADQRSRARERYLAESTDLCQLESRMRELDRYY